MTLKTDTEINRNRVCLLRWRCVSGWSSMQKL